MGSSNTPSGEQQETKHKFLKLLYKFFMARGDYRLRKKLVGQMRELRERLCVSKELFVDWFCDALSAFSTKEHWSAVEGIMPAIRQHMVEHDRQQFPQASSISLH